MQLSTKAVAWHLGSLAAGAWGMAVFAQSNAVDLYALIEQLKRTWGELVTLSGMLAPFMAAGAAAYRTYCMKQVPANAVAVVPHDDKPATPSQKTPGNDVVVAGKVVGALLCLVLCGCATFAPPAAAQPTEKKTLAILAPSSELLARLVTDSAAAKDDADAHGDTIASACYAAINAEATARKNAAALTGGGALLVFQKVRDVVRMNNTPQGTALISGCAALVIDAKMNMVEFFTKIGGAVLLKGLLIP